MNRCYQFEELKSTHIPSTDSTHTMSYGQTRLELYLRKAMDQRGSLIRKLDEFIRAYYLNQLVNGALRSLAVLVCVGIAFALIESVGRFGIAGRTVLFWTLLSSSSILLVAWFLIPLLRYWRIGKGLSHEDASALIGHHFPEISDRLLNVLQLQKQLGASAHPKDTSLLEASIEERTSALQPVAFKRAVDWERSRVLLRYAIPILVIASGLWLWSPTLVKEPANRILAHRQDFVPPPPFSFLVDSDLKGVAMQPFTVTVSTKGDVAPEVVMMEVGDNRYRMERVGKTFQHTFPLVREDISFRLTGGGVSSSVYRLIAMPVPALVGFEVTTVPPAYTGLQRETLVDIGNLRVPEGTTVKWAVRCTETDSLSIVAPGEPSEVLKGARGLFTSSMRAEESGPYWFVPTNKAVGALDSLRYYLQVLPDQPPRISASESIDSAAQSVRYFSGELYDDYGFSRLAFAYQWLEVGDRPNELLVAETLDLNVVIRVPLAQPNKRADRFFFEWSLSDLGIVQGDVLEYWFEVWDNDEIHGPKMTRSMPRTFAPPSKLDIREERDRSNTDIEEQIRQARQSAEELREEMKELRRQLAEDSEINWKDERAMDELIKKQEALRNDLEQLQQQNSEKDKRSNEFSPEENRILEKQEQLQELMEQVMSDELKAMYDEMQRLMDEMDSGILEQIQEQLENMQVDQESLEKELDRALEQFKQLEYEVKMEEAIEDLKELVQKQETLAEQTRNEESPVDSLKVEQDELNKAFNEIQERLDQLDKDNQKLENPNATMDRAEERESIQQKMSESSDQLEQEKNRKASQKQKQAADEMQQMADQMESMMQQQSEESLEIDMDALRALLENIIDLSFDEESLMKSLRTTSDSDPAYVLHGQTQRRLKDDAQMVEDSLFELSLRIPQLAPAVNREIGLINHHMEQALGGFGDRETALITSNQQYVMTSFNNLALMLDDALQQMQQDMAQKQPGSGNCENPGGNGKPKPAPSAGDIKKMQQSLSERLQKMKEQMGEGANAGRDGRQQRQLSKELAQMAAQQAALRKITEKKAQELNADGSGEGAQMSDIAKEMEEIERDLVNKDVTIETLERQQDLLVRLLEAEKAEMTRGEDDKRKSQTGNQNLATAPAPLLEYLDQKAREAEWLRTIPLELQGYYRDRVNDYFNNLDKTKPLPELQPER